MWSGGILGLVKEDHYQERHWGEKKLYIEINWWPSKVKYHGVLVK